MIGESRSSYQDHYDLKAAGQSVVGCELNDVHDASCVIDNGLNPSTPIAIF